MNMSEKIIEASALQKRQEIEKKSTLELLEIINRNNRTVDLVKAAVTFFQQQSGCESAGIRLKDGDDFPYCEARGAAEFICLESGLCERNLAGNFSRDSRGNPHIECMCADVIFDRVDARKPFFSHGGSFWTNSASGLVSAAGDAGPKTGTRLRCSNEGYESIALIPLHVGTQRLGLIQLNDRRKDMFSLESVALWERLACYLAIALAKSGTEEQLLRESEQQFRTLVESAPDGIFIHVDGRFVYANEAAARLYGAGSDKELLGSAVMDRIHPDYRADVSDRMRSVSEQRKWVPLMLQKHFRFDGTSVDVECRSVPINYGKSDGVLVIVRDITARLEIEDSLLLSESRYSRLFEDAVLGIFRATPQGKVIMVNPAYARMFGFESPDEVKRYVNDVATDLYEDPGRRNEIVRKILESNDPVHVENLYKRKDGGIFIGNLHTWAVRDRKGKFLYLEGFVEDITERKHAEMKLRESELNLRNILHTANEGFWAIDSEATIKDINPKMCVIMGRKREEVIGRKAFDFVDAENRIIFEKQISLRNQGLSGAYEIALSRPDGSQVFCQLNATPLWNDSGGHVGSFAMVTDITERKHAELENARLEAQLRQSQKLEAVGTLAGGIAHDFNNILQPIIGYTEMALNELSADSPIRGDLEQVRHASFRAKELVKQILAISRMTDEQQRMPINIGPIIKEAMKFLRASLPTSLEIRESIQAGMALADPTQIHQVLMNLCTNAAHAMGEKGVLEVGLSKVSLGESELAGNSLIDLKPGDYLELRVSDTGFGMDEPTMARIFDPYFTTKDVGKGSGLGLAVVNGIVKRHEGAVIVRSEPGKGSTFIVYIPRAHGQSREAVQPDDSRLPGFERILMVDDEPKILSIGERILKHLGYKVLSKINSRDALDVFRSGPSDFDLVITDYTMPGLTGIDLAGEMRKIRPDIPVLLCTGYSESVSLEYLEKLGLELLMKPYTIMELSRTVRMILDRVAGGTT